jgi:4-hydroxy-tetrahydrodipicolinate reductase
MDTLNSSIRGVLVMNILLNGCNGRMGVIFTRVAAKYRDMKIVAGLDIVEAAATVFTSAPPYPIYIVSNAFGESLENSSKCSANAADCINDVNFDVVVDFSHSSALSSVLDLALSRGVPVVLATTGHSEAQMIEIKNAAKAIPVFKTANMSIGVNLMLELVRTAASALAENFDIEIVEAHHNQKVDAPSGTALMLADAINDELSGSLEYVYDRHSVRAKREKKELGMHAIRGGTIVGEHSVLFAGSDEVVEIKHSAFSRDVFAEGTVRAVRFIVDNGRIPGLYSMRDIVMS